MQESTWNRRRFLKTAGTAAAGVSVAAKGFGQVRDTVYVAADPRNAVVASKPVQWAIERLTQSLTAQGIAVKRVAGPRDAEQGSICIVAAGAASETARGVLRDAHMSVAPAPEALGIASVSGGDRRIVLACGHDARGLVYALTEIADVVDNADEPMAALHAIQSASERPANEVRSWTRLFTSDVQDKPWYNDRAMWPAYFDMLAAERFNRFNLAFGIGYDFLSHVTDAYFLFTYPFLVNVPGYNVRVPQLPDAERDSNLAMLKYIGEQCAERGLEFHIGLWMHGYKWMNSPHPNYTIEGLDSTTQAPYCRDALRMVLQHVPTINGLTFRIHGESGVREGDFSFWKTLFDGAATCGRTMPIDMHAKGMSQPMLNVALATKQPVSVSPKFWAEHLGMTYHQADIREIEKPKKVSGNGFMSLSSGTRSFLRYGYGDLLRENRQWKVVHRIWSGTQRLLLWGDPRFAAAYSRAFQFCGSNGVEIQEPLSFKGRRGSGLPGSRCAYADKSLDPRWDWQKYAYTSRLWGRMLYNPETKLDVWRRQLKRQMGPSAPAMEIALANVSRVLPIVTTSYLPSAANNNYWPEIYTNQSLVDAAHYEPYGDTLPPRVFGNASPLDPELFLSANETAAEMLASKPSGHYTIVEAAQWLEDFAASGRASLQEAEAAKRGTGSVWYRRAKTDAEIQAGMGAFFGAKFRAGVLFHLYELTGERAPLEACIAYYKKARAAWAALAQAGDGVYMADITVGPQPQLRGCWTDRLTAIDKDIAAVALLLNGGTKTASQHVDAAALATAMRAAQGRPHRVTPKVKHTPAASFRRGAEMALALATPADVSAVTLHYRHVDQAVDWIAVAMQRQNGRFSATIPAAYTQTEFPMEYYFTVTLDSGAAGLYPGFGPELTDQPYFAVKGV